MNYIAQENVSEEVAEEVSLLSSYWNSIDWPSVLTSVLTVVIQFILVLLLFWIIKTLGNYLINLTFKRRVKESKNIILKRKDTLHTVTVNIFNGICYFILIFAILEIIGVPVGSLIAGAGIFGLALSLGAQGFVSDIVNGFTFLAEKQLDIGEIIVANEIEGTVIDTNLKTTKIKSYDGSIHYIPNREITMITNKSRSDMRAQIHIRLYPNNNLEEVRHVIDNVNRQHLSDYPDITEEPTVIFVPKANGQLSTEITFFTEAGEQYGIEMAFYELYVKALIEAGFDLPSNTLDLVQ